MMDEEARQQELVALKSAYGDFSDLSDGNFAHFTGLLTAYMRALESNHKNAMFTDPFANMLAGKEADALTKFIMHAMNMEEQTYACWKTLVAFRTRFADTALLQRPAAVKQVVLLGAGLDARAFRMETLRDCKVFELDAGTAMQGRKANIFAEHDVKPIAKDYHVIIRDLEELGWEQELLVQGYDPQVPTFWLLEGLLMYMTQPNIVKLLEQIDGISAPDSQMWADVTTHREFSDFHDGEASGHWKALNSNDDDPLHGVLTTLKWKLEVQADLSKPGEFFGRSWSPTSSEASGDKPTPGSTIEHFFMLATKPDSKIP